jgi:gag-polyprotein putative aspartyl protease
METIKERIHLQIVEDRLRLTAVIECARLRVRRQLMDFVVDTGSSASYLSDKDVRRLQIPMRNKAAGQEVDFGGSRFRQVILPSFRLHLLKEDNAVVGLSVSLNALQTTKQSEEKRQIAQTLPSILGMDFLKQQKLSLHVLPSEGIAYLQRE